jgi:hypothetical protein
MESQLAGHLLEHVKTCWPEACRRNEVFVRVEDEDWRFVALQPSDIPPRSDSSFRKVCLSIGRSRRRSAWEPVILSAIELDVDGDYPLPRGAGWILIDLIGATAA